MYCTVYCLTQVNKPNLSYEYSRGTKCNDRQNDKVPFQELKVTQGIYTLCFQNMIKPVHIDNH